MNRELKSIDEEHRKYMIQWRREHPNKIKLYGKHHREKFPNYGKEYMKEYKKSHPDDFIKRYREVKEKLYSILGGKTCVKCGFSDERALQFDHINGGGVQERKRSNGSLKNMLWKYLKDPDIKSKLQVLCANCNWIKRAENGEVG